MAVIDESAREYVGERLHTWQTWGGARGGVERVEVDVVVVGAGPGGLTTGTMCAEGGMRVLVLEGGGYWRKEQFKRKQSWALEHLYQDKGQRVMMGNAVISLQSGRGVGGGTLVNSAISFRAPDRVLDEWVNVYGVEYFEASAREGLYSEVERMVGVAPTAMGIAGKNSEVARRGLAALGVPAAYMPRSSPGCTGCAACQLGCPSGGKASGDLTWLPRMLRANGEVYADTKVHEIILRGGRAVGVRARTISAQTGEVLREWEVMAGRVVLAGGAVNSALMLMGQGLGGESGQVGRNLHVHPSVGCLAMMGEGVEVWWGATQGYYAHHPDDEEILLETFSASPDIIVSQAARVGYDAMALLKELKHVALCGLLIRDKSVGRIEYDGSGSPRYYYDVVEADRVKMVKGLKLIGSMFFAAGARSVKPLVAGLGFLTSEREVHDRVEGVRDVADMQLYASHPMGTCRVGSDARRSVVRARDGQVYGVEGLYVTDSSLFPTALGVNPQLTIMAQSLALGRRMVEAG